MLKRFLMLAVALTFVLSFQSSGDQVSLFDLMDEIFTGKLTTIQTGQFISPRDGRAIGWSITGYPGSQFEHLLVFLGGTPTSEFFGYYFNEYEPLRAWVQENRVQVLVVARPGYGRSDDFKGQMRQRNVADDVVDVVNYLYGNQQNFVAASHSGGGSFVAALGVYYPDRVEALAILAGDSPLEFPVVAEEEIVPLANEIAKANCEFFAAITSGGISNLSEGIIMVEVTCPPEIGPGRMLGLCKKEASSEEAVYGRADHSHSEGSGVEEDEHRRSVSPARDRRADLLPLAQSLWRTGSG